MRLTRRLLTPILAFLVPVLIALIAYNAYQLGETSEAQEQNRLDNLGQFFLARLQDIESTVLGLSVEVANNPEVQAAFAAGDRQRLIELTYPSYVQLDAAFDLPQYQFHLPPATSFLRLHSLDQFGDDLSSFRFTVLDANRLQKQISGPEIGRGGLGVRGVVPVQFEGRHIGTVEFGANIDLTLLNDLKSQFGADWQILLSRELAEIATFEGATSETAGPIESLILQASTLETPLYAPIENYLRVLNGEATTNFINASTGQNQQSLEYSIRSVPLRDYSGKVIGAIEIIADRSAFVQQRRNILITNGLLGVTILALISLGTLFITTRVLRPVKVLTDTANAITKGDLTVEAKIQREDELGLLANAFNSMTRQLRNILGGLEQRVQERMRDLELASDVGKQVSQFQDTATMLTNAAELIRERFNLYYTQIYLLDPGGRNLVLRAGTGVVGETLMRRSHRLSVDFGSINGTAVIERQAVIVEDTTRSRIHRPNPLLPETRSEIAIPLLAGERVVGVLDLQSNQPGGLGNENLPAFQALAGQLAIAIVNDELFSQAEQTRQQTEEQSRRLVMTGWDSLLNAVDRREHIGYTYDLAAVKPLASPLPARPTENVLATPITVGGQVIGAIQFEGVENLPDESVDLVRTVARQVGQQLENLRLLEQANRYQAEAQQTLRRLTRQGWETLQPDTEGLGYLYRDFQVHPLESQTAIEASHSFPISVRQEPIGEITVAHSDDLTPEEQDLINSVQQQLAAHLENLRLAQATQNALTQSEALYAASAQIVQATTIHGVLRAVVEHTSLRQFERASLLLFNRAWTDAMPETGTLAAEWERSGKTPLVPVGTTFPLETIPTTRQARRDQATFLRLTPDTPGLSPEDYALVQQIGANSAVFPVMASEQWLGWISAASNEDITLSEEELRQVATLIGQASAVIQSVRLLNEATARARREQSLRQIANQVRAFVEPDTILKTAARELGNALGRKVTIQMGQPSEKTETTAEGN